METKLNVTQKLVFSLLHYQKGYLAFKRMKFLHFICIPLLLVSMTVFWWFISHTLERKHQKGSPKYITDGIETLSGISLDKNSNKKNQ